MHTPFPIIEETEEEKKDDNAGFLIPRCCRLGLKDCPHRARAEREKPVNIGL